MVLRSLTSLRNKKELFLRSSGEVGCLYTVLQEDGAQVETLQLEKSSKRAQGEPLACRACDDLLAPLEATWLTDLTTLGLSSPRRTYDTTCFLCPNHLLVSEFPLPPTLSKLLPKDLFLHTILRCNHIHKIVDLCVLWERLLFTKSIFKILP